MSTTGTGEFFIRGSARAPGARPHRLADQHVQAAADATIADIGSLGGDGGLIALDARGRVAFAMNTSGMYRGFVSSTQPARTAIYATER